jgi:hypothetical protein
LKERAGAESARSWFVLPQPRPITRSRRGLVRRLDHDGDGTGRVQAEAVPGDALNEVVDLVVGDSALEGVPERGEELVAKVAGVRTRGSRPRSTATLAPGYLKKEIDRLRVEPTPAEPRGDRHPDQRRSDRRRSLGLG